MTQALEKVTERPAADAPNMKRPGADLIAWFRAVVAGNLGGGR